MISLINLRTMYMMSKTKSITESYEGKFVQKPEELALIIEATQQAHSIKLLGLYSKARQHKLKLMLILHMLNAVYQE